MQLLARRALLGLSLLATQRPSPGWATQANDPRFNLALPDGFVASTKSASQGTIYVAGNFVRAAVVSVTAWPLAALIAEDAAARTLPGIPADPIRLPAEPRTIADLGDTAEFVRALLRVRDASAGNGSIESVLDTFKLADDGSRVTFSFLTPISVANPDELEKQQGVRSLSRRTEAAALLRPKTPSGPTVVAVWGSALEKDWEKDLGEPIQRSVSSFAWAAS